MNFNSTVIRPSDPQPEPMPGLEHIDMRNPGDDPGATVIGDLIAAVRRKALGLVLWILSCLAVSVAYTASTRPEFVASAQIVLEPRLRLPPGTDAAAAAAAAAPTLDSAQAESQLQVIRSARNLRYVFDTLNLKDDPAFADKGPGLIGRSVGVVMSLLPVGGQATSSPEEAANRAREMAFQNFADRVQVKRLGQSYVLEVSFRGPTPEMTARLTNSIAAAYIRDQVLVHAVSEQRGTEFLQGRISLIQSEKKAADEAVATGVISDFQFPDSDARIVGSAPQPLSSTYPQTKLNLLLALVLGLVTGVGAIAIAHNFDRILRSPAQVRRLLGIDCLVVIPRYRTGILKTTTALDQPDSDFALALRLLRTILFSAGGKPQYVSIGFASCQDGDGCSAIAANLARLLAVSGTDAMLVDANLQKPDLTRLLAPSAPSGLDELLLSPAVGGSFKEVAIAPSLGFVPAVAAGRRASPNAFLGTHAMRAALTQVNGKRDIILDLPTLKASSDAQAVGSMLTGVVLVASLNRTKLDELAEAIRAMRSANSRVLGVVLNSPVRARHAWHQGGAKASS
ncbi:tyrosine-protein kinase domain-containing protein [Methylobacterium sp. J-076]|uniref:tyrosine-protein kinase domain-containing protein n=1 Tax=Methylobacterium sp. J-076 TaxID=2836655 RepID=UPI001FB968BB|nr:tyrosine-protein kinase domain-containing protein [Methylobacterium sp. J-076]MCJ2012615.1 hypothetical protein [Methylobacterium sp. J-076]